MSTPTYIVAGLGRCGTSMCMQMLAAGGIACIGDAPAYEDNRTRVRNIDPEHMRAWSGAAVKVLDPQIVGLPGNVRVIWLDRDAQEQARSAGKFAHLMAGIQLPCRWQRRRYAERLRRDRVRALRVIGNRPVLLLTFERVLADPLGCARAMAVFLDQPLDVHAMAAVVRRRPASCLPGLDLELQLVEEAAA
jgi:hypothetical protein